MNPRVAFPFLTLPDEAVNLDGWMIGDPDQPLNTAGDILQNWDYARDLEVGVGISIDWNLASQALQLLPEELQLKLVLIVGTGAGTLPRRQDRLRQLVVNRVSPSCRLSGVVPGQSLSGRLRLSLHVTLEGPCGDKGGLSPTTPGSRLWQCHHDVLIEDGGDSRFPVEAISFAQAFPGKPQQQAPWYLHWRPGMLQADFSACVRLYVNSDRPEVLSRFVEGDGPTLQAILGDVMSQMVEPVLDQEDLAEILADCDEGSVGRQIRNWLDHGFPGQDVSGIRAIRDQSPGTFRAAMLAASDMAGID